MYRSLNTQMLGHSVPFDALCALAAQNGFEGVDLSSAALDDLGAKAVQRLLQQYALRPGIVSFPLNFKGAQAARDQTLARLNDWAPKAADIGYVRTTAVVMPGDRDHGFARNFALHVEGLTPIAQALAQHGIRLGLEFIGPKTLRDSLPYPFLHTMDGVRGLCAAIGTDNMGLLVDLFHLYTSHTHMDDVARLRDQDIVLVHLNDARAGRGPDEQMDLERDLPGATGVTDCAELLRTLQRAGYTGPCSVEPFQPRLKEMPVAEAVAATARSLAPAWSAAGLA